MATATRPPTRLLAGLALLALSIAACNPSGSADPESVALDAETPTDSEASAAEDPPTGDETDDAGGGDPDQTPSPPGEVLASAETAWGGSGGGPVRLDLLSVARRGADFLEVRFALTATGDDGWLIPLSRLAATHDSDASGVMVEDVDAGERLLVLRDSADECVCSTNLNESIDAGTTREYFARLPAPVSDRVDVNIPTFRPFNDVPVS